MKPKSLRNYPYKFAAVGGAFWGLSLFFATIIAAVTGYGADFLNLVGGIYPSYEINTSGAFIALFFGFADGFMLCYLVAYVSGGKKKEKSKK
jgi:hypothetical protein